MKRWNTKKYGGKMQKEDIIYNRAKESLRRYGRKAGKNTNEKVIYECAVFLYAIRQEYRTDTRIYSIAQNVYERERMKILQLQNKISKNEESYEKAIDFCTDALVYIELVVRARINIGLSA